MRPHLLLEDAVGRQDNPRAVKGDSEALGVGTCTLAKGTAGLVLADGARLALVEDTSV